jgi:eukaryotic-like serine/threonine-protein kinase
MSEDQDREIEALFDSVVDMPAAEQEAALAALDSTSPALVARVRSLLRALEGDLKIAPEPRRPAISPIPQSGDRIGPYLLVEEVGEGGFGVVFRASRQVGEQHADVAIKFLKIANQDPELEKRFALERQVLAELSHPGIARLIDGGTTAQGVPYLVMEFVQGEPITAYCNHRHFNISQRLALFVQACAAVEYAHGRQFLHRDLKPENIFVSREGHVKLLDFGIIKMLAPEIRRALPMSMPGRHLFSLTHASPEQVAGNRLSVASDVYSLGVVLYELLSGQLPFGAQSVWNLATARALQGREPGPPSKAIYAEENDARAERGMRPRHLERILRGDLDAISLAALRRTIEDRYPSVEALRLDIQRFLAGLPVEARRSTRLERVSKWARRNPVTFAAFILACVLYVYGAHQTGLAAGRERRAEESRVAAMSANQRLLAALPELIRSLRQVPASIRLQELALGEQLRLLQQSTGLPRSLDEELAQLNAYPATALCAWNLGHPQQAEQLVATSIDRLGKILERHPNDAETRKMEIDSLCMRSRFHESAGQLDLAEADRKRYEALNATMDADSRRGPCPQISNL